MYQLINSLAIEDRTDFMEQLSAVSEDINSSLNRVIINAGEEDWSGNLYKRDASVARTWIFWGYF